MSDIYAELLRMKLSQSAEPPGWTSLDPETLNSHYVLAGETRPVCELTLHYSGRRFNKPPDGARVCADCKFIQAHAR
jgi:hypothetical protein